MRKHVWMLMIVTVGCISLTAGGAAVRTTTNPDVVRGCSYVGNFSASSTTWGLVGNPYGQPGGLDQDNAEASIRNRAAAAGADTLFLNSRTSWRVSGEAYVCRQFAPREDEKTSVQKRISAMMVQISEKDPVYEPLKSPAVQEQFLVFLLKLNPLVSQINVPFLEQEWFAFLKSRQ